MPCVDSLRDDNELGMHEEEFNDGMQVEWAKACACMN